MRTLAVNTRYRDQDDITSARRLVTDRNDEFRVNRNRARAVLVEWDVLEMQLVEF